MILSFNFPTSLCHLLPPWLSSSGQGQHNCLLGGQLADLSCSISLLHLGFQAQGVNHKDSALSTHCIMITSLLELLTVASAVSVTVFSFGISEIQAN